MPDHQFSKTKWLRLRDALAGQSFDVVIASYGRLRSIAEVLKDRAGHLRFFGGTFVAV